MDTPRTLTLTIALGLALVAGVARADGPGGGYGGQEIGAIRYINRAQNLVTDIRWDLNHSVDATSDVAEVGHAGDHLDSQVHAILHSYLGIYDTHT